MEVHVEHNDIGLEGIHELKDSLWCGGDSDCLHIRFQEHIKRQKQILIVVHYQYLSTFFCCHAYVYLFGLFFFGGGAERFSKLVSNVKNSDHLFICKGNFWAAYPKGQNTRNWRGRISVMVKKYR